MVITILAAAVGLMVAAWAFDSSRHEGRVARNVAFAGRPVGGLSRAQAAAVVQSLAGRYADAPVVIEAPGGGFRSDSRALGLTVPEDRTLAAVMPPAAPARRSPASGAG